MCRGPFCLYGRFLYIVCFLFGLWFWIDLALSWTYTLFGMCWIMAEHPLHSFTHYLSLHFSSYSHTSRCLPSLLPSFLPSGSGMKMTMNSLPHFSGSEGL